MMLQGDAKRAYQRVWMRRKRAGKPTANPKPWKPTKRMVDQVRYWLRTGAPQSLVARSSRGLIRPTSMRPCPIQGASGRTRAREVRATPAEVLLVLRRTSIRRAHLGWQHHLSADLRDVYRACRRDLRGATQAAVTAPNLDQMPGI